MQLQEPVICQHRRRAGELLPPRLHYVPGPWNCACEARLVRCRTVWCGRARLALFGRPCIEEMDLLDPAESRIEAAPRQQRISMSGTWCWAWSSPTWLCRPHTFVGHIMPRRHSTLSVPTRACVVLLLRAVPRREGGWCVTSGRDVVRNPNPFIASPPATQSHQLPQCLAEWSWWQNCSPPKTFWVH